jgi:hypothetical protein
MASTIGKMTGSRRTEKKSIEAKKSEKIHAARRWQKNIITLRKKHAHQANCAVKKCMHVYGKNLPILSPPPKEKQQQQKKPQKTGTPSELYCKKCMGMAKTFPPSPSSPPPPFTFLVRPL